MATDGHQEQSPSQDPVDTDASSTPSVWPGVLIAMLGGQAILMLVMVYLATSDRSFAVEPDYYQQALRWDDITAQRRASVRLGWSAHVTVSEQADIYKIRDVTCLLTNKSGEPITDAAVSMIAFSHARGSMRTAMTLDPKGHGQYHSRMKIPRPGLWEFRIVVRRGDVSFVQVQEVRITATGSVR